MTSGVPVESGKAGRRRPQLLALVAAVLTTLLLPSTGAAAADDATHITIDPAVPHYQGRIDFDVPIYVTIPVGTEIRQLTASVKASTTCSTNTSFLPTEQFLTWTRPVGDSAKTILGVIPAVDANRFLCLRVSTTRNLRTAEHDKFIPESSAAVDVTLQRIPVRFEGLSDAGVEQVRIAVAKAIASKAAEIVADGRAEFEVSSMFGSNPGLDARLAFREFLRAAEEPSWNHVLSVQDLEGFNDNGTQSPGLADSAAEDIERLVDAADFSAYATAVANANNAALLQQLRPLLALKGPNSTVTTSNAKVAILGGPRPAGAPELMAIWNAAALNDRVKISRDLLADLRAVQTFMSGTQPNSVTTALSAARRTALRALVDRAESTFEPAVATFAEVQDTLQRRTNAIDAAAKQIALQVVADAHIGASTFGDFNTRAKWFASADVGIGYSPALSSTFPYVGVNFYFHPVNKEAPLSVKGGPSRRFSMMIGSTYGTDLTTATREKTAAPGMLVVAPGYRLTDILRASAGFVFVRDLDSKAPLTGEKKVQWAWFYSISIDWDARATLAKAFGTKDQPTPTVLPVSQPEQK